MAPRGILYCPPTRSSLRGPQEYASQDQSDLVSIETLRMSMRKRPLPNLNNNLLERLVRTGLLTICFTERQKLSLLHAAGTTSLATQSLFHKSMMELNLVAIGLTKESPMISVCISQRQTDNKKGIDPPCQSATSYSYPQDRPADDANSCQCRNGCYFTRRGAIEESTGFNEGYWRKERDHEFGDVGGRSYRRWERDEYLASPLQSRSQFVRG